jgi:hypothetical protein
MLGHKGQDVFRRGQLTRFDTHIGIEGADHRAADHGTRRYPTTRNRAFFINIRRRSDKGALRESIQSGFVRYLRSAAALQAGGRSATAADLCRRDRRAHRLRRQSITASRARSRPCEESRKGHRAGPEPNSDTVTRLRLLSSPGESGSYQPRNKPLRGPAAVPW